MIFSNRSKCSGLMCGERKIIEMGFLFITSRLKPAREE
jgi:hypothetical protein